MEELFETLKEDLAGQEVDEEGHEEEEEPQEEAIAVQAHTLEDRDIGRADEEAEDRPITELRTVRQQLDLIRGRRQTNSLFTIQSPEPFMLKLNALQKQRLQQQLQQHVQLLIQIHLLTSPVSKLHSEAETTRQFLFELDMLAQRGELIGSSGHLGFRSTFRASNLQEALELLEEMRRTPINYQPQHHKPDARGNMRCFPVMPAELAWLFATRPVFLHPELLPSASLDPAMYCPRRTAAFTSAEDCLLVLGLRNMEGACDPPKLVSQFLLRQTVIQVRRRILQCCRPGTPDNIVKAFRYQQVVRSMLVACRHVDPVKRRPPVEREEDILPLWLVRSLPVIYPFIKHFNSPAGPAPEASPSCRRTKAFAFVRSAPDTYSFPPETKYPPRLPKNLDFKRLGFVLIQQHLPSPPHDSSQVSESLPNTSPPSPPQFPLQHLLLSKAADKRTSSTVSTVTIEQIRHHSQTLAGLRKRRGPAAAGKHYLNEERKRSEYGVASIQGMSDDVIRVSEEEMEEEGEVLLALSESSPSASGSITQDDDLDDLEEAESESEPEVTLIPYKEAKDEGNQFSDESRASVIRQKENQSSEATDEDDDDDDDDEDDDDDDDEDDDQRESEDVVFAQDYLQRVCEAVQLHPGLPEQLLQVLDELSAVGPSVALGTVEVLYNRLSCVLRSWPQLLKDFAAFLNHKQARRCGLLLEQQLFERSRRFLRRLGWSLGESSSIYQQVVSLLQGGSAPSSEDIDKVSSLLRHHPDLQEEVQDFFKQLHTGSTKTTKMNSATQNPHDQNETRVINTPLGSESEEEREQRAVCAKNITVTSNGEKVVVWTREADRIILTACQQRGANRKTFRQVSTQLGNKTVQQVCLRFQELMKLFLSASEKSTSCSPQDRPLSRHSVAPD